MYDKVCIQLSQVTHQARAYPGFCSVKQLRVLLLSPGTLVHRRITPSIKFTGAHLYHEATTPLPPPLPTHHQGLKIRRPKKLTKYMREDIYN